MNPQKRQLVFLWPYVEWGGAQIYCMAIMKIARKDWDVAVIMPRSSPADLIAMVEGLGVRIEHIESALDLKPAKSISRKLQRHKARIKTEIESYRALTKYDPKRSVLHVDIAPWQSWVLFAMLSFSGANVFVTLHNFFHNLPRWRQFVFKSRMQFVSRLPNFHIFTANRHTKDKLKGWVSSSLWSEIAVTKACVDRSAVENVERENVDKYELRRRFAIPEDKFVVLTVGQFVDRKGRWVLLDAAKKASEIDKDIVFIWVMPSPPPDHEAKRVLSYGLGGRFRLVLSAELGGRLDVLRFYKVADCFALPSFVEGLPISLLEAMALGVPAISTNIFAIPEAVRHEETGLLINPGDPDELCESILRLKNDRHLSASLSSNARRFVLENFDERDASHVAVKAFEASLAHRQAIISRENEKAQIPH